VTEQLRSHERDGSASGGTFGLLPPMTYKGSEMFEHWMFRYRMAM